MIEIPYGRPDEERGRWKGWRVGIGPVHVLLSCPTCGMLGSLDDHAIAPDGAVSPSVDCMDERCPFHDSVKLLGWRT